MICVGGRVSRLGAVGRARKGPRRGMTRRWFAPGRGCERVVAARARRRRRVGGDGVGDVVADRVVVERVDVPRAAERAGGEEGVRRAREERQRGRALQDPTARMPAPAAAEPRDSRGGGSRGRGPHGATGGSHRCGGRDRGTGAPIVLVAPRVARGRAPLGRDALGRRAVAQADARRTPAARQRRATRARQGRDRFSTLPIAPVAVAHVLPIVRAHRVQRPARDGMIEPRGLLSVRQPLRK